MSNLILCYVGASQQSTPPMALVGELVDDTGDSITIKGPMSSDVAYFSLVGKRLKPVMDRAEMEKAREDRSMRGLPQLSPSDFIMMGVTEPEAYLETTMTLYHSQLSYTAPLAEDSAFAVAYNLMVEGLSDKESPLYGFFVESVFDFDTKGYLSKLMNPDELKDIIVPAVVGADERG
jgi:hypothetical protein